MDLVWKLLIDFAEGILYGIVFLIVAFIILPTRVIDKILRFFRPDWVSKKKLIDRVKLVLDYILNCKDVVVSSGIEEEKRKREEEIKKLIHEKHLLENNMFFLDMLKSLSSMLRFSVMRSGYSEDTAIEIIEKAMEYLMHYGNQLQDTEGAKNQKEMLNKLSNDLNNRIEQIVDCNSKNAADKFKVLALKQCLRQGLQEFDTYMSNEYDSTRNQLANTNQILAQKLMEFVEA